MLKERETSAIERNVNFLSAGETLCACMAAACMNRGALIFTEPSNSATGLISIALQTSSGAAAT